MKPLIIIGLLFLTCCTIDKTIPKYNYCYDFFYYENGKIKTVHVFKDSLSKKNNRDYFKLEYDSTGYLTFIRTIVNRKYNNYSIEFHKSSGNVIYYTWENNKKHGLYLIIDKYGRTIRKIIVNQDSPYADFRSFITKNGYITRIYCINDSIDNEINSNLRYAGQYYQDKKFKIIRENSFFYFIKKLNDPMIGNEHTFRVYCNFSNKPVTAINLKYEINHKSFEIESKNHNFVRCSVMPYRKGVNVLIGSISIGTDTIMNGQGFIKEVRLPFAYQFVCD